MNDFLKLTHFIKVLNNRTNGFITAKRLKFKLQQILNLNISSGIIQSYRKKFLGMNYRRSRFKTKIFTQRKRGPTVICNKYEEQDLAESYFHFKAFIY